MSHFRSGTISWDLVSGRTYTFTVQQSYRASYFTQVFGTGAPVVGGRYDLTANFYFGDGSSVGAYLKVLAINTAEDYLVGELVTSTGGAITRTYLNDGNFEAYFSSNARIASDDAYNQLAYRTETIVNVGTNNEAPVSSLAPIIQVADNSIVTLQVPATDANGDTLTYRLGQYGEFISGTSTAAVAPAGLTISSSGLITWDIRDSIRPSVVAGQKYVLTLMIEDGKTKTPVDVILQVVNTSSNQAPVFSFVPPAQTLTTGQSSSLGITATDPNGNLQSIQLLNPPAGMTTEYHASHSELHVNWTPSAAGTYVVTVLATDTNGLSAQTSVTYTVFPANTPPLLSKNVAIALNEGATTTVSSTNLLVTDSEQNPTFLTFTVSDLPDNGQLLRSGVALTVGATFTQKDVNDGLITYRHNGSETTVDSFSFSVADGQGGTVPATAFSFTINPVNDAPVVIADVSATTTEGGAASTLDALRYVSDAEGAPLAIVSIAALPAGVTADLTAKTFTLDPANAAFDSLAQGQTRLVQLQYSVSDGAAQATARAVWTVVGTNDAPVVSGAVAGTAAEGGVASTLNALANASDVDNGAVLGIVNIGTLPAGVSYDAAAKTFTLDPTHVAYDSLAAGQTTGVTVTYQVSDGIAATPASVTWTVTGTNDAPMVSGAVTGTATEGGASSTLNALANASDIDAGTVLTLAGVVVPPGVSYDAAAKTFTLDPSHAAFNGLAAGQTTDVTVSYSVFDGIASRAATAVWTVTGTNDAPVVAGAVVGAATEGGTASTLNALANASDPDAGATLTVVGVPATLPAGVTYDAAAKSFTLDPRHAAYDSLAAMQTTVVTVGYAVSDGTASTPASVSWTVTGANDAPVVTGAITATVAEGSGLSTLNALANASDVDAGTTLVVIGVGTLPTGVVTYDPVARTFTLDASSGYFNSLGVGQSQVVTIPFSIADTYAAVQTSASWTVTGTNDAPSANADDFEGVEDVAVTGQVLTNDSDSDLGTTLTAVLATGPQHGSVVLNANGTFTYTPTANYNGEDSFTYRASDGIATSGPVQVKIVLAPIDDAPQPVADAFTVAEDGAVTGNVLANDVDIDSSLQAVVHQGPANGSVQMVGNGAFTYTPKANFSGTDSFTYLAFADGKFSAPTTVTLTVTPVNDAPVANADAFTGPEDVPITGNVLSNDSDVDGNTLTARLVTGPTKGALVLKADGTFSYTPDANYNGADSFTYKANDGTVDSVERQVSLTITPVNDPPFVAGPVTATVAESSAAISTLNALANASDVDAGTTLAVVSVGALPAGVTYNAAAGTFSMTPSSTTAYDYLAVGQSTTVTVDYVISDGVANAPAKAGWTITGTNDAPVVTSSPAAAAGTVVEAGAAGSGTPVANGQLTSSDADTGATAAWSGSAAGNYGAFAITTAGAWTYTLDNARAATQALGQGDTRTETFTATVTDDRGATATRTVTVTVDGANDAPVAVADGSGASTATVVTFDSHPGTNDVFGNVAVSGFNFSGGHFHIIAPNSYGVADSDTPRLIAADSTPVTMTKVGGGAFDLTSFLLGELYYNVVTTVTVTGTRANGSTVSASYTTDGIANGPGAPADLQLFSPTGFTNLTSVTFGSGVQTFTLDTITVGQAVALTTTENAALTIDVLANDTDVDAGAVLTVTAARVPAGQGSVAVVANKLVFTPGTDFDDLAASASQTVTIDYTIADQFGATSSSTATVVVTGTNDAPVVTGPVTGTAVEDGAAVTLNAIANASDVDEGTALTVTGVGALPAGVTYNATAKTFTLDPANAAYQSLAAGQTTTVTVTYQVSDGSAAVATSARWTVTGTNDGPVVTSADAAARGVTVEAGHADDGATVPGTGSAGGQLTSSDVDAGATAIWSGSTAGTYGAFAISATGAWTYTLDNLRAATQALAEGEVRTETFTATVTDDKGATASRVVTVTVTGTNDAPLVTSTAVAAQGAVVEAGDSDAGVAQPGTDTAGGQLASADVDAGATATWSGSADGSYGSFAISAGGAWTYTLDNARATTQALAEGETRTERFTATVTDDKGATAAQVVTVTVTGTNDAPTVSSDATAASGVVTEAGTTDAGAVVAGTPGAGGRLTSADVDAGAGAVWSGDAAGIYGSFAIAADGVWTYALDNLRANALAEGDVKTETFVATVTDDKGAIATQTVTVTVAGTNDAPVVTSAAAAATGQAIEAGTTDAGEVIAGTLFATGRLSAADPDANATLTWSGLANGVYGSFAMADNGQWTYTLHQDRAATQALAEGETRTDSFVATVTDDAGAVATQTVTITVTGTNDGPVVTSSAAAAHGTVAEAGNADGGAILAGTPAAGGQLTSSDVDAGASATWSGDAAGSYGSFAITATGAWTYALDNARTATGALTEGETRTETFTATVTDDKGAMATQLVTITVTGTNDSPVVTSTAAAARGSVSEAGNTDAGVVVAGTPAATGQLTSSDVDAGATATWSGTAAGAYGSFAIAEGGAWTYTLDNARAATQALAEGETKMETFTATVTDDKGATATQMVTVTVTGTNDSPVVTSNAAAASGSVTEAGNTDAGATVAGTPAAGGQLTSSDVDAGASATWSGDADGSYGAFAITATGAWTYALDNARTATGALTEGETRTETFTATVTDDKGAMATQLVTITVTGTNDSPVVTSTAAAARGSVSEAGNTDDGATVDGTPAASGQLTSSDVDAGATATWSGNANGAYGSFAIAEGGAWTYTLDNARVATQALAEGETKMETFTATVTDDKGATATQVVTVIVTGTNDSPLVTSTAAAAQGTVAEAGNTDAGATVAGTPAAGGQLTSSDVDAGASATWTGDADGSYGAFAITASGAWTYTLDNVRAATQALAEGETRIETFTATVTDDKGATAAQVVTVTVTGTNDSPVVTSAAAAASGAVAEAGNADDGATVDGTPAASGQLTSSDVDAGATATWSGDANGAYGSFAIAEGGAWTYTLDNARVATQALAEGQKRTETFTATVTDDKGATATRTVTVTVTGTNDSPVVTSGAAAARGTVVEAGNTPEGLLIAGIRLTGGQLSSTDVDAGATATWTGSADGIYGSFALSATGNWVYTLDNARAATQALAAGEIRTETFTATVTDDKGATATQIVTVTVLGTNDSPVVTSSAEEAQNAVTEAGNLDDGTVVAGIVTDGGRLASSDVDGGATATWSGSRGGVYGDFAIAADGTQSYTLDNGRAVTDALAEGETVIETFVATVTDDQGATATQVVTVTITGTNDSPVITTADGASAGIVAEAGHSDAGAIVAGVATAEGQLTSKDVDAQATAMWSGSANGVFGAFAVTEGGAWTYTLDNARTATQALAEGASVVETFTVTVTDDKGAYATQLVRVIVIGTNDRPVVTSLTVDAAGAVAEAGNTDAGAIVAGSPATGGRLTSSDVDADATAAWTGSADGACGSFAITADGNWAYILDNARATTQALAEGETRVETFTATVTDDRGATATQIVTVTITGTNDSPVVTSAAAAARGMVVEAGSTDDGATVPGMSTAVGQLTSADVDAGATATWSGDAAGSYGSFAISTGGAWSYTLDNARAATQALAEGQTRIETFTATVTDDKGAVATQVVTVTVTGTNDSPVVTSAAAAAQGAVAEAGNTDAGAIVAGTPAATGQLASSDVDAGATATWSGNANGAYGSFAISATGAWTYTLDNARVATQALAEGDTQTETFVATVTDDKGAVASQVVTVTVTGTNDSPVVTSTAAAARGAVVEAGNTDSGAIVAGAPAATGQLTSSDADAGATAIWSGDANGTYGTLAITATGAWTYTLDNARAATQALAEGETRTETFTATVTDDRGAVANQVVTVTVTGTNDSPVVTSTAAAARGAVSEAGNTDAGTTVDGTPSATGVLTASDVDAGATASWSGNANGTYGAFAITATGSWTYTLDNLRAATQALAEGEVRTETFTATVTDDKGATATQVVAVTVTGTNDSPIVVNDTATTNEDTVLLVDVIGNDRDLDAGDVLTLTKVAVPAAQGAVAIVDGKLRYDPSAYNWLAVGESATVAIGYEATDRFGAVTPGVATVTVTGVNDRPTAAADSAGVTEDRSVGGNVLGNDSDPDRSDVLSVSGVSFGTVSAAPGTAVAGTHGTLTLQGSGQWTYEANADALDLLRNVTGLKDVFGYTVSDGRGGTAQATLTVNVTLADDERTTLGTVKPDVINGDAGGLRGAEDTIYGDNGDDVIHGLEGADVLHGENGDDRLFGDGGRDRLFGGNGKDTLDGGTGDDILNGGNGNDQLTGGAGADIFVFDQSSGTDLVTDFLVGVDRIQLDGTSLKSMTVTDVNGDGVKDLLIQLSTGSVQLLGVSAPLGSESIIIV